MTPGRLSGALLETRSFLSALLHGNWLFAIQMLAGTEWTEGAAAYGSETWPHCCTQGGCWMHSTEYQWCGCGCRWCRVARVFKRGDHTIP